MGFTSGPSKQGKSMQHVLGFIRRQRGTTRKDVRGYLMDDHDMTESRAKRVAGLCLKRGLDLGLLERNRNLFSLHRWATPLKDRGANTNCGRFKKHKGPNGARGGRRRSRSCRGHGRSRRGRGRGKPSKGRGRSFRRGHGCSRGRSRRGRGGSGRRSRRDGRSLRGCKGRRRRSLSTGRLHRCRRGDSTELEVTKESLEGDNDLVSTIIVNFLLGLKVLFLNFENPTGGVQLPRGIPYSIKGFFVKVDNGYEFRTPKRFKQYWALEGDRTHKGQITPEKMIPAHELNPDNFEVHFSTAREVTQMEQLSFLPHGICVNVKFQNKILAKDDVDDDDDDH